MIGILYDKSIAPARPLRCAGSRRPTRYAIGGGAKPVLFLRHVLPDRAFDAMMPMGACPQKKGSPRAVLGVSL